MADIQIIVNCPAEKQAFWQSIASGVIPLTSGDAYTAQAMKAAVDALKKSSLFEFIHVPDPEKAGNGMSLTFELTPFGRIRDILIDDAFPCV